MAAEDETPAWARELLRVWFDRLGPPDWFSPSDKVDAMLEERFAAVLTELGHRPVQDFLTDPDTARAAILLFDQVPRNIYRGTAKAFAHDATAGAITHGFVERGWLPALTEMQAQFVLMPLMHSEEPADQDLSVELFEKHAPGALDYARDHREAIARFGRFPHRNHLLGRDTTDAETRAIADGLSW